MEIRKIDYKNYSEYEAIAKSHGSVFNQPEWLAMYASALTVFGIFNNDKKLIGAFNSINTGGVLSQLKAPPYSSTCALFVVNKTLNKANNNGFYKELFADISKAINPGINQVVRLIFPPTFTDFLPFLEAGFKVTPEYTYQLPVATLDEAALLARCSPERRNDLKKAEKDGIVVSQVTDYTHVKALVKATFDRKKKGLDEYYVDQILFKIANSTNSFAFVTYRNDAPSAVAFCMYDKFSAYYLLGGYDASNRHQGAGALAVWSCIKHTKSLGIPTFDFEGSTIKEVERYFRGFGGDFMPMFSVNKAYLPIEMLLKPFYRSLF